MTKKERKEREGGVKEQEESKDYNKTSRADFTLLSCLYQYCIQKELHTQEPASFEKPV